MQALPKPSRKAQADIPGAKKVLLSDVFGTAKRKLILERSWGKVDVTYSAFMLFIHGLCLFAPMTFSWPMVGLFAVSYLITGKALQPCALTSPAAWEAIGGRKAQYLRVLLYLPH